VEHYCIAILMLEGLVTSAVTANWDGLLEKALDELTPAFGSLVRVAVKPDDFRIVGPRIDVIKFHGCAVRAREEEAEYRGSLIARATQISGWTEQPQNRSMRKHLEVLYTDRLTFMVGLSAQDANLHTVFAAAIQDLARPWPASPPAVVLSADFPSEQFGRLGVALALIGRGLASGHWSAVPGDSKAPDGGVVRLISGQRDARVFFVKDATTSTKLEMDNSFDDDDGDVLIVVADEEPPVFTRSPRPRFGRDGKISSGRFNVASSIADTASADDLFEAFKLAGGF
jgi:hypothetical protein